MAIDCTCNNTLENTGRPGCPSVMEIAKKYIAVPLIDSTGAVNKILKSGINKAALQAKIDAVNPLDRYFPFADVENVEDLRDDPVIQEFNSGKIITVRDGARTVTNFIPLGTAQELGKYKSYGCSKFGMFIIDKGGNFIFRQDPADPLNAYPITVDNDTYHAMMVKATDAEIQMIMLRWQWKESQKDQDLRLIESSNLDFTSDDLNGLFDVDAIDPATGLPGFTAITTTTFTGAMKDTSFETDVEGLVLGDFTLAEVSPAPGPIAITSVTESSPGVYDFVIPVATSGDVLRLSATKSGFDFSAISDGTNDIDIP
jgi:hypothetical protein